MESPEHPYRMPTPPDPSARPSRSYQLAIWCGVASIVLIPTNFVVWIVTAGQPSPFGRTASVPFVALAILQIATGIVSCFAGFIHAASPESRGRTRAPAVAMAIVATLTGLGGVVGIFLAIALQQINLGGLGGAWGRPLRVRGRILHPNLRVGSDWTRGERPRTEGLDAPTRRALEALWLHDAQKEHASVPAFARIAWLLSAVGAPAELLEGAHRAALEEIDHARRCFALAAGYGTGSHSVEPMPELLVGGLDLRGDALVALAVESLKDGCLLEDFNADVAAACERACRDTAARDVLARIAREERSHAEFSWGVLEWVLARGGATVRRALEGALAELGAITRPTAVSDAKRALVAAADPAQLRAHGRLPDAEWAALYVTRLAATEQRVQALLTESASAAA